MTRRDDKGRQLFDQVATSDEFARELRRHCDWFCGVPDSVLKNVIPRLTPYHFAPRENHAVAAAFGARLGGKSPCVLMQNSGLGLSLDAILGLFSLYGQGLLMVISNRGELAWEEIQHQDWGKITLPVLDTLGVEMFDFGEVGLAGIERAAELSYREGKVTALIVHRGNLDE